MAAKMLQDILTLWELGAHLQVPLHPDHSLAQPFSAPAVNPQCRGFVEDGLCLD